MVKNIEPKGFIFELSDNRLVFVGQVEDREQVYIGLRSKQNTDTYFSLSPEAALSLLSGLKLLSAGKKGKETFPHKQVWRLVPPEEKLEIHE